MQKLCFLEGGSAIILGGREGLNHVRFMLNFLCEGGGGKIRFRVV